MTLGERIHLIRRRQGMTQKALAEASGLNPNTIARLEQGSLKDLGGRALGRLADALHTSTDYLLGRTNESGVDSHSEPAAEALVGAVTSAADDALIAGSISR